MHYFELLPRHLTLFPEPTDYLMSNYDYETPCSIRRGDFSNPPKPAECL